MPTIFAQATAAGRAGVAIIRISGEHATEALKALGCTLPKPRIASLQKLIHPASGEIIDHALVLWFPAPHSFTGEDTVELHTHGSRAVLQELLNALSTLNGLRLAEPGEFARRAFANEKMDLTQAEGLADLIDAETAAQKRQALRQMDGALQKLYDDWREELVTILAHLEAYIDFPDEDLPQELDVSLSKQIVVLADSIQNHLQDTRGKRLREGVYVAIVGAPNAGKSSLVNVLAQRDVAIVSAEAGTTRDAIEAHLDLGGYAVTLCDTAGLREGAGKIESEGIRRARQRAEQADLLLCMFDATTQPDEATFSLTTDPRALIVMNKIDLCKKQKARQTPVEATSISISTTTGEGISELLRAIGSRTAELAGLSETPALTRERHRAALLQCHEALTAHLAGRESNAPIELCTEDVRRAAQALGSITGRIHLEELMDKIFSSFCIGK